MDWIQELDDLVQDLLMEALTVELCRAALAGCAPRLAQFPPQALSGLLSFEELRQKMEAGWEKQNIIHP